MEYISSQILGLIVCSALAMWFVTSLYLWEWIDPLSKSLGRNHPSVIQKRSVSVIISVVVAWIVTVRFVGVSIHLPQLDVGSLNKTAVQTVALMLGPIAHILLAQEPIESNPWILFRNLVLAPIAEEIVFRECFVRILHASGFSRFQAGFVSPIIFAAAHLHHSWGRIPISVSLMSVAHTCVFGWIASYFLIKRSVWDSIVSHAICNAIGLPNSNTTNTKLILGTYLTGLAIFVASLLF
jgi:prenyl protein peptidase